MSAPYPWQVRAWTQLVQARAEGRLGHAYLVAGAPGLGKLELAQRFAALALCEDDADRDTSCGRCRGCLLMAAGNHPDFRLLQPAEERRAILIDQVRELAEFYALKSHYAGARPVIIEPADGMNHAAANALLKLLEEPPPGALLLLVASRPGLLPATIASRCQRILLRAPPWPERLAWLESRLAVAERPSIAGDASLRGAPLELLARAADLQPSLIDLVVTDLGRGAERGFDHLAATRRYQDADATAVVDALEAAVQGAVLLVAGAEPRHLHLATAARKRLQGLANTVNWCRLLQFLDGLGEARQVLLRSSGVRGGEVVENLWFRWTETVHRESTG